MSEQEPGKQFTLTDSHFHAHVRKRMELRGVSRQEVQQTLLEGVAATNAKPGTFGKTRVFPYGAEWEEQFYEEKEVTVYYKWDDDSSLILLTVIARYGKGFARRARR